MKTRLGKYLPCKLCGTLFYAKPYQIDVKKFCSHKCYGNWKKGREEFKYWLGKIRPDLRGDKSPMKTPEMRRKMSEARRGIKLSNTTKEKLRQSMVGRFAGEKHWNWKGGKFYKTKNGKNVVYLRNHDKNYEHRLVAEKTIGRKLKKGEVVHHIDGNSLNNNPSNLMVFSSNAEHLKFHSLKN